MSRRGVSADEESAREALAALVRGRHPAFVADGAWFRRSIKCHLVRGSLDGVAVVAKRVVTPSPMWRWYTAREAALLDGFARAAPPFAHPRRVAWHPDDDLLVVTAVDGAPLANGRATPHLDAADVDALVAWRASVSSWSGLDDATLPAPSPAVRDEVRARMLEDPTAPLAWCLEGLDRGAALGLLDVADASRAKRALREHPVTAFSHGDALLRNVLRTPSGLVAVDWECAGLHPEGWDLALLWPAVPPAARPKLEAPFEGEPRRRRAHLACVLFALVRELKFRGAPPRRGDLRAMDLVRWRDDVARRLREG